MSLGIAHKLGRLQSVAPRPITATVEPWSAALDAGTVGDAGTTNAQTIVADVHRECAEISQDRREILERVSQLRRRLELMERGSERGGRCKGSIESGSDRSGVRTEREQAHGRDDRQNRNDDAESWLEVFETEHGSVRRAVKRYRPSHVQGQSPIARGRDASSRAISRIALEPRIEDVDLSRALFFDTETTGLSRGTGTLAFMVGMAWFEDDGCVVEQLVLPQPGEEAPLLHLFAERLASASCVVSYNGKSFDWPLLKTRFVMNRMKPPPLGLHIDLLHCARRVFRERLRGMTLGAVEEQVLGMGRVDDMSGALIPASYRAYLLDGDERALLPVLEHNRHDLVSLAALLGELSHRFDLDPSNEVAAYPGAPRHSEPRRRSAHATDQLGLASTAYRARDFDAACRLAEYASIAQDAVARRALWLKGHAARRSGDIAVAVAAFHRALACAGQSPTDSELHLALSKLYEHRIRDIEAALRHARWGARAEEVDASAHRCTRLSLKLGL
ncbi:MAG: ribonuclease H-like domain-containing protein [Myxococcota bacterium]